MNTKWRAKYAERHHETRVNVKVIIIIIKTTCKRHTLEMANWKATHAVKTT